MSTPAAVFGCSGFGLFDAVTRYGSSCNFSGFYLADVVVPKSNLGAMRTGLEAETERVHSGLPWPLEARVSDSQILRRIPVPCAWRALVESEDKSARWKTGSGASFSITKIITAHVKGLINDQANGCRTEGDEVVLAIPDDLDEFGQDSLLRELNSIGLKNPQLLWRPVAAALAWLDQIQDDLPEDLAANDHIHVIFLGADSIEFTTLRLRNVYYNENRYTIPLRDRRNRISSLTGFDWAAAIIEKAFGPLDAGAFWQAFTTFPEVWQAISGRVWRKKELPRIWSKGDEWTLWHPTEILRDSIWEARENTFNPLRNILGPSYQFVSGDPEIRPESWSDLLRKKLEKMLSRHPNGKLFGIIVCGPLAPPQPPSWLLSAVDKLRNKNPDFKAAYEKPCPGSLWLCHQGDEPISKGAAVYGHRIKRSLPTYRDTLQPLSILAAEKYERKWFPLVDSTECEGGRIYTNKVSEKFNLRQESTVLDVYLQKGLTTGELNDLEVEGENRTKGQKYKKTSFTFPSAPLEDKVLDISVTMKPASGLAQVEIIPKEKAFLRGRRVFLDYSRMRETNALPEIKRGWPDIVNIRVFPDDRRILRDRYVIKKFLEDPAHSDSYKDLLLDLRQIFSASQRIQIGNNRFNFKTIDQYGKVATPEGQEIINQLKIKLEQDFMLLKSDHPYPAYVEQLYITASWLFEETPISIVNELKKLLQMKREYVKNWHRVIEATGRVFKNIDGFKLLFMAIVNRVRFPGINEMLFPLQSAKAVWLVLMYRHNGHLGLDRSTAVELLNQAVTMMEAEVAARRFLTRYFQGIKLFFYLLRFRLKDHSFMNPENKEDADLFSRTIKCLNAGKTNIAARNKANKLLEDIESFIYFEGAGDIIHVCDELDKLAGE